VTVTASSRYPRRIGRSAQIDSPAESQHAAAGAGTANLADDGPKKVQTTVIKPSRGWVRLGLAELWQYRELLYFLAWRDVKVKYKQTAIGFLWVVVQPVATMIVFTFIFGRLAKVPTNGVPYPLFAYSGLLPWQLFATGLMGAGTGVVGNAGLLTKVYFPRLIIPIASIISGIVDFCAAFLVLIALMVWYGRAPTIAVLALPLFLVLATVTALAVGLWLSMINVRYRDVQYTIPFLTQIWLFLTPIAYATTFIPERYRLLMGLNPITSVVGGFRWALLGAEAPFGREFFLSVAMVGVVLLTGIVFFKRMEKTFADVI
jgi:lipopolysaccharide transport system permease protein